MEINFSSRNLGFCN